MSLATNLKLISGKLIKNEMKNIINILLLTLCLLVECCAKTPTNSVNTEKTLNEQYPFAI